MGSFHPTRRLRRLWFLIRSPRLDAELAEEMDAHRAMAQAAFEADGLPADAATHAARRAMGSTALARDRARDVWRPRWLQGIGQDVRLAVRILTAAPLISAVAILSLGLGIGGNTAIFSIINGIYLRPLPGVPEPERLIFITGPTRSGNAGIAVWERLRERPQLFARAGAFAATQFNIASSTRAEWVDGLFASGSFFDTLGIAAHAGRLLTEADDREGGGPDGPVAVISYSLWQRRYGGTADVIGRVVHLQRAPFTIVGVMPSQFAGPTIGRAFDVVAPRSTATLVWAPLDIGGEIVEVPFSPSVVARLHPGQTLAQANAALETVRGDVRGRAAADPIARTADDAWRAIPLASRGPARAQYEQPLIVLAVVVALVLLIACANIANLMLARAAARQQELSVRRAIGAPRWRLIRQCLAESVVLAGAGAACGLAMAFWASRLIVRQLAAENVLTAGDIAYGSASVVLDAAFDWRVLAFTTTAAALTALAFGLIPALRSARIDPIGAIKQGAPTSTLGTGSTSRVAQVRVGATGTILVLQVALSLMLVVASGLFIGTFSRLTSVPLGIDAGHVILVNLELARASTSARLDASTRIRDTVRALPDVRAAALSAGGPPFGGSLADAVAVAGVPPPADPEVNVTIVSDEWFEAFGLAQQSGRTFSANDRAGALRVAIVNEAFARKFLGGANPLGRQLAAITTYAPWPQVDIVGVVGDVASIALREPPAPAVYLPLAQLDGRLRDALEITLEERGLTLVVRAAEGRRGSVVGSIAEAAQRVEPSVGTTFKFPDQQIEAMLTRERVLAMLAGFFGVLALLLSGLGLYGVAAYAVARQRKEIAVRLALGAAARTVFRLVLGRVLVLVAAGVAVGIVFSLWASQLVATFLYGTGPRDVPTFVLAAVVLLSVGGLAAWLPARRATRTDPALVLRYE